jgi:PQQ-like domain
VYLVDRDGAVRAFDALSGASAWSVRRSRDLPLDPGQENKVTTGAAIVVVTARRGREVAALDVRDGAVRWAAGFRHPVSSITMVRDAVVPSTRMATPSPSTRPRARCGGRSSVRQPRKGEATARRRSVQRTTESVEVGRDRPRNLVSAPVACRTRDPCSRRPVGISVEPPMALLSRAGRWSE